jgi:hypothetical protein
MTAALFVQLTPYVPLPLPAAQPAAASTASESMSKEDVDDDASDTESDGESDDKPVAAPKEEPAGDHPKRAKKTKDGHKTGPSPEKKQKKKGGDERSDKKVKGWLNEMQASVEHQDE